MSAFILLQYVAFLAIVGLAAVPAGIYMDRIFSRRTTPLERVLGPLERGIYRFLAVDPRADMDWKDQAWAFTLAGLAGAAALFVLLLVQGALPGPPAVLAAPMTWDLALNTAISFATGTTWQAYAGESALRHGVQVVGLVTEGFLAGGTGLALGLAFIRAFKRSGGLGNFWSDAVRAVLYLLLPLAFLLALVLVGQGTVMAFRDPLAVHTVRGGVQTLVLGPAAVLESIKNLGTNGGGFFAANGAHPLANPTPLTNFLGMLAIVVLPAGLTHTFGRMTGRRDAGWMLFAVMALLFTLSLAGLHEAEGARARFLPAAVAPGPSLEGREVRFGLAQSVLAGAATSSGACGSSAVQPGSSTPLGAAVMLACMLLGEVAFGGLGTGLAGLLMTALVAVFLGGLMIGRTPEYLGKSVRAHEVKLAILHALVIPAAVLLLTALALCVPAGRAALGPNVPARQFTEVVFAYASCAANNGQAMGALSATGPFWNLTTALAMLLGRFGAGILVLAAAGAISGQRRRTSGPGSLPAGSPVFGALLFSTVILVTGLSFLPTLVLGPVAEWVDSRAASVPPARR
jgi:K+-transporting ATPase ATPase A chain